LAGACSSTVQPQFKPDDSYEEDFNDTGGYGFKADKTYFDENNILVRQTEYELLIQWPFGKIVYNVDTGLYNIFRQEQSQPVIRRVYTEVSINDETIKTLTLTRNETGITVTPQTDNFGNGVKISVKNSDDLHTIIQNYFIYTDRKYILMDAETEGEVSTNYFAVMKAGKDGENYDVFIFNAAPDLRFLYVPYDNDGWERYNAKPLNTGDDDESYEVAAIFENTSRRGFITGSVTHDIWKTGIRTIKQKGNVTGFKAYGGATSLHTRDADAAGNIYPHGAVSGASVKSPKIFFGFYDDWRDGMEEYGKANGIITPPLKWDKGTPFGWNSWGAYDGNINYTRYVSVSDYMKEYLPGFSNGEDEIYTNIDSFWYQVQPLDEAVKYIKNNGQLLGIYHTPFTCWHGSEAELKSYSPWEINYAYTWFDLVLKDKTGKPLRYGNMGWPLDPTHPGVIAYNDYYMKYFRDMGFSYVKLDFMSHGAMEGEHWDKTKAVTGIQAYNYGMKNILNSIGQSGGKPFTEDSFFVSLSIAPVFPSQYAHSRRISCDIFGTMADTQYLLNSVSYGWWINNSVYPYNDPDYIVMYKSYNQGPTRLTEGISHYIAAAITGGLMLFSDDISQTEAAKRVKEILNNEEINRLAADNKAFRPLEGNTGTDPNEFFIRDDREADGYFYIAYFNFTSQSKNISVNFQRTGLDPSKTYAVWDMISHNDLGNITGKWTFTAAPEETKLYKIKERNNQ